MSHLDDVIHELCHTLGKHGPGVALKFNEQQIEALKLAIAAYALDAVHDSGVFFEAWSVCGNADQEAWGSTKRTLLVCSKCGKTNTENKSKYCGDGSDKDNEHRWTKAEPAIEIVMAGVGPGHPKTECSRCGVKEVKDKDGYSNLIATCTHTEYVTLCESCYRNAGNSVR